MKVVIIVQARMTSTRLPGKVLKEVLGKPLLEYQIERLRRVKLVDQIVIATTTNASDMPIVELCDRLEIPCFCGSEEDVLARYHGAATAYHAGVVVRITSDCPIIDPAVVDDAVRFYLDHRTEYDYVSNGLKRTYPRGMDAEVFPYRVLHEAYLEAVEQPEREHVTPFVYHHPQRFRLANVAFDEEQGHQRWTVDTPEDFELIRRIIEALYPANNAFTLRDVLNLLMEHPDWAAINAHIEQKKIGQ